MSMSLNKEELISYLGESVHVAFRKGTDAPQSAEIWQLISDMEPDDWNGYLEALFFYLDEVGTLNYTED